MMTKGATKGEDSFLASVQPDGHTLLTLTMPMKETMTPINARVTAAVEKFQAVR